MSVTPRADADGGWKDIIEAFTEDFFQFFFPDVHAAIDFSRGVEFLDTELRRCVADARVSQRQADRLLRAYLKSGEEQWLLIHIEVQGDTRESAGEFAERMFIYNYRIYDLYRRRDLMSLAVLTDASPSFRPREHRHGCFGSILTFVFPSVKLIDFNVDELDRSDNPFARATEVHLGYLKLGMADARTRSTAKLSLSRRLYERGHRREEVIGVLLFIDALMRLPGPLELQYRNDLDQIEGEYNMPYMSTFEKHARLDSRREDVIDALEARFGEIPYTLRESISHVNDDAKLKQLHRQAVLVKSLDELKV